MMKTFIQGNRNIMFWHDTSCLRPRHTNLWSSIQDTHRFHKLHIIIQVHKIIKINKNICNKGNEFTPNSKKKNLHSTAYQHDAIWDIKESTWAREMLCFLLELNDCTVPLCIRNFYWSFDTSLQSYLMEWS